MADKKTNHVFSLNDVLSKPPSSAPASTFNLSPAQQPLRPENQTQQAKPPVPEKTFTHPSQENKRGGWTNKSDNRGRGRHDGERGRGNFNNWGRGNWDNQSHRSGGYGRGGRDYGGGRGRYENYQSEGRKTESEVQREQPQADVPAETVKNITDRPFGRSNYELLAPEEIRGWNNIDWDAYAEAENYIKPKLNIEKMINDTQIVIPAQVIPRPGGRISMNSAVRPEVRT